MVSRQWATAMTPGLPMEPSKTHGQENFPVASVLIAPKHRATILAYYRFARGADDVADSPSLAPDAKLAGLDLFEATLTGRSEAVEAALPRRAALRRAKVPAASCARSAARLPDGCRQTSLRELVRIDGLLRLFGGASRALRSRCAWRERIHLARIGRALHGASDYQSFARLRRRLSQPRSRLCSARCVRRARPSAGCARRRESLAGAARDFARRGSADRAAGRVGVTPSGPGP